VHLKIKVPAGGVQKLGSFTLRVKADKRPKLKIILANLAKMPADLRAAAGNTKGTRSGGVWTFKILVAMNNLAPPKARRPNGIGGDPADVLIRIFSGKEFEIRREFVDDCLTRAEQRAYEKTLKIIASFLALGPWPSTPQEIFKHVLEGEKARCP
jgi:hypothetical protein